MEVILLNNVEYIEPLENGHSGQAPEGMIEITVAELLAEIDTILEGLSDETAAAVP